VKVAAFQAPLLAPGCMEALDLIRTQVRRCESEGITILCCPEAILGGLADNDQNPSRFAITTGRMLETVLAPLASSVTTIVGFTELGDDGRMYNSAAVSRGGKVVGVYRKLFPAIRRSLYSPGHEIPVFRIGDLTFGIAICNDSNYPEPAKLMAAQGATAVFVPTNNGLPPKTSSSQVAGQARACDVARAVENNMWVVRADVAGEAGGLVCRGASEIVDPEGTVVAAARPMSEDLIIAEIETTPHARRCEAEPFSNRVVAAHSSCGDWGSR
jgi:5-aminopentanamidase